LFGLLLARIYDELQEVQRIIRPGMKKNAKLPINILLFILLLMIFAACSTFQDESSLSNQKIIIPQGMLSFEGSVFVASTKPSQGLWRSAGWQIADNSTTVSDDQVPVDCTLYPHEGVENQWIGSCAGNTLIPRAGASHIQVLHTPPDGITIIVQVAPTPEK
jgi:hypothetical protein